MENVGIIQPSELAEIIKCKCEKVLIVDARTFCEYNTCHIVNSVNVWSSKIRKKKLQQNSISVYDFLQQACHISLQEISFEEVIVYDQSAKYPHSVPQDSFLHVLLVKLASKFNKVCLLQGGFLEFQAQYYEMCEDSSQTGYLLTSFSQPCLPVSNSGPTKILPFLFLGSQHDANNKQLLLEHNISYELNVSTTCPKPEFLMESHFLRIAVNDNFSDKILPHFGEAFKFIDKVREVGGRVLVHCLAGISRSPTVVISYVMKYLHLHYDEAYRYVKNRRPNISPNINFVGQLLEFDLLLFGKGAFFRSPLRSLCIDDIDISSTGLPSPGSSPLTKSSSSSCITSDTEFAFPFPLNRSLPSLRLNKSVEEGQAFLPLAELECLRVNEPSQRYVSSRLPSSPVSPPTSPEVLTSFPGLKEECSEVLDASTSFDEVPQEPWKGNKTRNSPSGSPVKISTGVDKTTALDCLHATENEELVTNCVERDPSSTKLSKERSFPSYEGCKSRESFDEDEEMVVVVGAPPTNDPTTADVQLREGKPKTEDAVISSRPISLPHAPLRKENSNDSGHMRDESYTLPPKTMRNPSRKVDLPHLPRSYSSSETYLSTRTRLEKQNSASSVGSNTRKSFSSDEVGRGFQSLCPPPTPPSAGFHKEAFTNPIELARCDSWSTSGLGSEISDWDSVQGDAQSMEDTQGPFDAVFAEVFPGEAQNSTFFKETYKKYSEKNPKPEERGEQKLGLKEKKGVSDHRKSCSGLAPEEPLGTSPTPRPVSLPGVSGTYYVTDPNLNADMGVELDDNREWPKENGETYDFHTRERSKRGQILFEHPPVNPRTMGDDVKYIMTWYKIDSSPQAGPPPSKADPLMASQMRKEKPLSEIPPFRCCGDGPPQESPSSLEAEPTDKDTETKDEEESFFAPGEKRDPDSLHERWQWWDTEFKKKIRNIRKNVSLTSWDSLDNDDKEDGGKGEVSTSMAGFHLAQELMQSMEDLLEREICDIKERASSLSTRFGLPMTSLSEKAPSVSRTCGDEAQEILQASSIPTKDMSKSSRETGLRESFFKTEASSSFRAKSEPPLGVEENLYRVKSCPGIAHCKGMESIKPIPNEMDITFRFPRLFFSRNGHSKRYSCSALDFLPTTRPTFESCPDVRQLNPFRRTTGSSDSPSSSPHSSFHRLLKVS